jgi:hypothetical protein
VCRTYSKDRRLFSYDEPAGDLRVFRSCRPQGRHALVRCGYEGNHFTINVACVRLRLLCFLSGVWALRFPGKLRPVRAWRPEFRFLVAASVGLRYTLCHCWDVASTRCNISVCSPDTLGDNDTSTKDVLGLSALDPDVAKKLVVVVV